MFLSVVLIAAATPSSGDSLPGVAVVELFTSEGCSSCPPADRVLQQLVASATDSARPIYCLSFHVDYWDRLGWRDRFSDASFTERQQRYSGTLKAKWVYTPQMVVNGQVEFVGSESGRAADAIAAALKQPAKAALSLHCAVKGEKGKGPVHITFAASAIPANTSMVIALVEREARTEVKRGENTGRSLVHVNVVRQLVVKSLDKVIEDLTIDLPEGLAPGDAKVIAFIHESSSLQVLGATAASIDITPSDKAD